MQTKKDKYDHLINENVNGSFFDKKAKGYKPSLLVVQEDDEPEEENEMDVQFDAPVYPKR